MTSIDFECVAMRDVYQTRSGPGRWWRQRRPEDADTTTAKPRAGLPYRNLAIRVSSLESLSRISRCSCREPAWEIVGYSSDVRWCLTGTVLQRWAPAPCSWWCPRIQSPSGSGDVRWQHVHELRRERAWACRGAKARWVSRNRRGAQLSAGPLRLEVHRFVSAAWPTWLRCSVASGDGKIPSENQQNQHTHESCPSFKRPELGVRAVAGSCCSSRGSF